MLVITEKIKHFQLRPGEDYGFYPVAVVGFLGDNSRIVRAFFALAKEG